MMTSMIPSPALRELQDETDDAIFHNNLSDQYSEWDNASRIDIAWYWLNYMINHTGDDAYLFDLLDAEHDAANLIKLIFGDMTSLRNIDDNMKQTVGDRIVEAYEDKIAQFVVNHNRL